MTGQLMSGQAGNEINSDDHIIIILQYYHQERKDELGFHPQIAGSANASAQRLPEWLDGIVEAEASSHGGR